MAAPVQWTIELVGPKGYIHGWIKVGAEVTHKDGSKGTVTKYDPNTQTAHVDWKSGVRVGKANKGTTKAYHLQRPDGGSKTPTPVPEPPKVPDKPAGPVLKSHPALGYKLGAKVAASDVPEGTTVHKLENSMYTHAVFHNGQHVGYANKLSGSTTLGRSGAAYSIKNTGFAPYSLDNRRMPTQRTLSDAATRVVQVQPSR